MERFIPSESSSNSRSSSELKMLQAGLTLRPELPGSAELKECLDKHGLSNQWPEMKKAYYFMKSAHLTQKRDDGTPYYHHCTRVAISAVQDFGVRDLDAVRGALFHDMIEDTTASLDEIRSKFGERTAQFTDLMTKPAVKPGETYQQRNRAYLQRIENSGSKDAVALKLADRYDNILDTHLMPDRVKIGRYVADTEKHYVPLACRHFPRIADHMSERIVKIRGWMNSSGG